MSADKLRFIAVLAIFVATASGCFSEPSLPTCSVDTDCPDELSMCVDGHCFVHTLEYATPLCRQGSVNEYCCQYNPDGTASQGCVLWATEVTGYQAAPLADLKRNRFYTLEGSATTLTITARNEYGDTLWIQQIAEPGSASLSLQIANDGTIVVSTPSSAYRISTDGILVSLVPTTWEGNRSMPIAAVDRDTMLIQTSEVLLQSRNDRQADLGTTLTSRLAAPVVWNNASNAMLVTGDGDLLVLVDLDSLEVLWEQSLAAPAESLIVYSDNQGACLTADGTIHVVGLDAGTASTSYWSVALDESRAPAGPLLVDHTGDLLFPTIQSEICRVNRDNRFEPDCTALAVTVVDDFVALRNGLLMLSRGDETSRIGFWLDDSHKDSAGGRVLPVSSRLDSITLPLRQGVFLTSMTGRYQAAVSPDIGLVGPWPTPHGLGRSRVWQHTTNF